MTIPSRPIFESTTVSEPRDARSGAAKPSDHVILMCAALLLIAPPLSWLSRNTPIPAPGESPQPMNVTVDPNHADAPTLSLLPGIGPATAEKIIADRATHGRYIDPNDLQRISGIGPKTVEQVAPWINIHQADRGVEPHAADPDSPE